MNSIDMGEDIFFLKEFCELTIYQKLFCVLIFSKDITYDKLKVSYQNTF